MYSGTSGNCGECWLNHLRKKSGVQNNNSSAGKMLSWLDIREHLQTGLIQFSKFESMFIKVAQA